MMAWEALRVPGLPVAANVAPWLTGYPPGAQTPLTDPLRSIRFIRSISVLAVLVLTACASQRVGSDYDHSAMFSWYQHFAWMPREDEESHNPLVVQRAHDAIEAELTRKGYARVPDPSKADFLVDFTLGAQERVDVSSFPAPYFVPDGRIYPEWWGYRYWGPQVDMRRYREGILAIDVFDVGSRMPVWHGWARKELTRSDVERSGTSLHAAVQTVLQGFPPR